MNFCYLCTRFNKKVMYDQIQEDVLYLMLYAGVMVFLLLPAAAQSQRLCP